MDFEEGKCYKMSHKDNGFYLLFKCSSKNNIKPHAYDPNYLFINEKNAITITDTSFTIMRGAVYVKTDAVTEEIDESVIDKVIKQFNIAKAAALATINRDKSNEKKENTTQGDYQLP